MLLNQYQPLLLRALADLKMENRPLSGAGCRAIRAAIFCPIIEPLKDRRKILQIVSLKSKKKLLRQLLFMAKGVFRFFSFWREGMRRKSRR